MWITMKFTWIPILLFALAWAASADSPAKRDKEDPEQLTLDALEEEERGELPILPPLILLDFTNGTNSSSTDEKTKRTVNDNLGYGFQTNNFFSGRKVNYYFPTGKTGTTVSIEESISPFLPRTIIERTKPVTEKQESSSKAKTFAFRHQQFPTIQPSYGQKTKLRPNPNGSYDFSRFSTTVKPTVATTQNPAYATTTPASSYSGFYTQKSSFQNPSSAGSYTTKKTPADRTIATSFASTTFGPPLETTTLGRYGSESVLSSTLNPIVSEQFYRPVKTLPPTLHGSFSSSKTVHPSDLSSYPKYTYENGVKYEHKIVWKYPDGRVLDNPPNAYYNTYPEYESTPKTTGYSINSYQSSKSNDYGSPNYQTNLRYQGPLQFPKDSEYNLPKQTPFVKPVAQSNARPKNYQYFHSTISNYNVPKLQANTANPEYLPPAEENSAKSQSVFPGASQLGPDVLPKYSSESQKLLSKGLSPPKESYDSDDTEAYTSSHYANLLNYNPSISQYIKNPASILNAQPTFIQAGNSLIPVIILRVDGAPPVQQKPPSSINLKALLQQYISQYANSISDLSRGTNYDLEEDGRDSHYQDPHYDLKKLTDALKQISLRASSPRPSVNTVTDSYGNVVGDEFKTLAESRRNSNYRDSYNKSGKVKSVEILEDPRFPNYKESR